MGLRRTLRLWGRNTGAWRRGVFAKSAHPMGWLLLAWLLAGLFGPGLHLYAQDPVRVEAALSNTILYKGESANLTLTIHGSISGNLDIPVVEPLQGVSLLSQIPSQSTSYQIINGRASSSRSFTYTLMAQQEGSFTIPAIAITIGGRDYRTDPIPFQVITRAQSATGSQTPDVFLEISVDADRPVVGQQVIASVDLYFRNGIEISSFQPVQGWRADGFWKEELQNAEQPMAETVLVGQERFRKATLLRYALFPTRSGELTLNPFSMMVGVRSRTVSRDPFASIFDSFGTNQRRVTLQSEPLELTVRPVPEAPEGVSLDAVGTFTITRRASRTSVVQGEGFEVITTVSGTGNLPLVTRPEFTYGPAFDQYSPQEQTQLNTVGREVKGERVFTEVLVARFPGQAVIPSQTATYFDPSRRRHVSVSLPAITVSVSPAPSAPIVSAGVSGATGIPLFTGALVMHRDVTLIGFVTGSVFWFAFLVLPLLAFLTAVALRGAALYRERNSTALTSRRAAKSAIERLTGLLMQPVEEYKTTYATILHIFSTFYFDRLGQPVRSMSERELVNAFQEALRGGDVGVFEALRDLLAVCGSISYAPTRSGADVQRDLKAAIDLVQTLDRELK